jgi:FkbM family methyltransferase
MNTSLRILLRRLLYGIGAPRCFGSLRARLVGPFGRAVLAKSVNGMLLVPVSDAFVGRSLCFKGCYDDAVLTFLLSQCNSASEVLVIGAHIGAFAIPLAKKVRHLVAVEANPATFELLELNVLLNGLKNMEIHNFAAGDMEDEVSFITTHTNTGGSRMKTEEWSRRAHFNEKPKTVVVRMHRLDEVFPDSTFDLMVMDIEGSEALALRGMQGLLGRSRALVVEIVEKHLRRIAKVTNEEFLSLVTPFFDEAVILPEGARHEGQVNKVYGKSAFGELMRASCNGDVVANVMFRRASLPESDKLRNDVPVSISLPGILESR